MKAIVVFHGSKGHPLDFILKKGFEHCFICVSDGTYWIELNIVKNVYTVRVIAEKDFNLADFYRDLGYTVISTKQRVARPSRLNIFYGSLMVANCVGLVKSILSINTFSWTPYSLYRELVK